MNPALKKVFCHPVTIEDSLQSHVPEIAEELDFSTLEALGPDQVGDELARRFPETLWIVRTEDCDRHVVIMLHFPAEVDPLMSVRVDVHSRQVLHELNRRMRPPPAPGTVGMLPLVIYSGRDRWTAPQSLEGLLSRCETGEYQVSVREPEGAGDRGGPERNGSRG